MSHSSPQMQWMEQMLDTAIAAYEVHRDALQDVYKELYEQFKRTGGIRMEGPEADAFLRNIADVLANNALQLTPYEDAQEKRGSKAGACPHSHADKQRNGSARGNSRRQSKVTEEPFARSTYTNTKDGGDLTSNRPTPGTYSLSPDRPQPLRNDEVSGHRSPSVQSSAAPRLGSQSRQPDSSTASNSKSNNYNNTPVPSNNQNNNKQSVQDRPASAVNDSRYHSQQESVRPASQTEERNTRHTPQQQQQQQQKQQPSPTDRGYTNSAAVQQQRPASVHSEAPSFSSRASNRRPTDAADARKPPSEGSRQDSDARREPQPRDKELTHQNKDSVSKSEASNAKEPAAAPRYTTAQGAAHRSPNATGVPLTPWPIHPHTPEDEAVSRPSLAEQYSRRNEIERRPKEEEEEEYSDSPSEGHSRAHSEVNDREYSRHDTHTASRPEQQRQNQQQHEYGNSDAVQEQRRRSSASFPRNGTPSSAVSHSRSAFEERSYDDSRPEEQHKNERQREDSATARGPIIMKERPVSQNASSRQQQQQPRDDVTQQQHSNSAAVQPRPDTEQSVSHQSNSRRSSRVHTYDDDEKHSQTTESRHRGAESVQNKSRDWDQRSSPFETAASEHTESRRSSRHMQADDSKDSDAPRSQNTITKPRQEGGSAPLRPQSSHADADNYRDGMVRSPSAAKNPPARRDNGSTAEWADKGPGDQRVMRTAAPRRTSNRINDSSQIERMLYGRTISPQGRRPTKPVLADDPAVTKFLRDEDERLIARRDQELREISNAPSRGTLAIKDANTTSVSNRSPHSSVNRLRTAAEEQLVAEQEALITQLERMQYEVQFLTSRNFESGSEKQYAQLNHRIHRVQEDLAKVDRQLNVVRNIERGTGRSRSTSLGQQ